MESLKSRKHEPPNLAADLPTMRQEYEFQLVLISRLEEENENLRDERNTYMKKFKEKRGELDLLQGKLDDATCEIADLKRALIRTRDTVSQNRLNAPGPVESQIPVTPPSSPSANIQPSTITSNIDTQCLAILGTGGAPEIDVGANSTDGIPDLTEPIHIQPGPNQQITAGKATLPIEGKGEGSGRRSTPRMVPFVSLPPRSLTIKRSVQSTNLVKAQEAYVSENPTRYPKRRKVEAKLTPKQVRLRTSHPKPPADVTTTASHPEMSLVVADSNPNLILSSPSNPRIRLTLLPPKKPKLEPKPKPKKENFAIPISIASEHLKSCSPLHINPPPHEVYVPRRLICAIYGGNDRLLIQKIKSHRNPSGPTERRLVFPVPDMNPSMPSKPGEPGLIYGPKIDFMEQSPYSLFSKDLKNNNVVWIYLGEYESIVCGTMSASLFKSQKLEVKKAWGVQIRDGKQWDVYVAMRARIALRKAKIDVTVDKVSEEMAKIKNNNGRPVSVEDIIAAFEDGAEGVEIIKMQCIAYDHKFASDLETNFNVWNSSPAHLRRRLIRGRRHHKNSDFSDSGGPGNNRGAHNQNPDLEICSPELQKVLGSTIETWKHLALDGKEMEESYDGAFDSDLTEYDYASSSSAEH